MVRSAKYANSSCDCMALYKGHIEGLILVSDVGLSRAGHRHFQRYSVLNSTSLNEKSYVKKQEENMGLSCMHKPTR